MARIIENKIGRRMIKINTDDIISVVKEYQKIISKTDSKIQTRAMLDKLNLFLPEEL